MQKANLKKNLIFNFITYEEKLMHGFNVHEALSHNCKFHGSQVRDSASMIGFNLARYQDLLNL